MLTETEIGNLRDVWERSLQSPKMDQIPTYPDGTTRRQIVEGWLKDPALAKEELDRIEARVAKGTKVEAYIKRIDQFFSP